MSTSISKPFSVRKIESLTFKTESFGRLHLGAAGWPTLQLRLAELSSMITGGKGNSNARRQIGEATDFQSIFIPITLPELQILHATVFNNREFV